VVLGIMDLLNGLGKKDEGGQMSCLGMLGNLSAKVSNVPGIRGCRRGQGPLYFLLLAALIG
jgi:hypothetical protein